MPKQIEQSLGPTKGVTRATWLGRAFAHCPIFPTAALKVSPGCVAVPVWLIVLLRPTKHYRLGGHLPRQLPKTEQASSPTINLSGQAPSTGRPPKSRLNCGPRPGDLVTFSRNLGTFSRNLGTIFFFWEPAFASTFGITYGGNWGLEFPAITHPYATQIKFCVRLACVRPVTSIHSEPESNSSFTKPEFFKTGNDTALFKTNWEE